MKRVSRIYRGDAAALAPPEPQDNGWLRVEGKIARIGIQEYDDASGTVHRELRIPEEVFDAESLRSFEMVPITNSHPPVLLDDLNTKSYQVGQAGQGLRRDGDFVVAPLMLTEQQAILAAKAGRSQLSNGYTCELDATQDAALVATWGPYDFVQRKIRGNHIALVDAARAGPEARIRLDSSGNAVVESAGQQRPTAPSNPERHPMKTITIDGIVIDTEAADAQAVITRTIAAMNDKAAALLTAEKKRADAADKRATVLKDNAKGLVAKVGAIRVAWDSMKARMVACDECTGSGKVMDDAGKEAACGYCDGKGSVRMHDAVKGMEAPDGDDEGDDTEKDMDESVEAAESVDEDELEVEQATEEKSGAASKKADAARRKAQLRKDSARERVGAVQRRKDSKSRQVRRAMTARIDLEMAARRYLDEADVSAADLRKLDDVGVMKAITLKLAPDAKLDGKTPEQIRARYDAELERTPAFTLDDARTLALGQLGGGAGPGQGGGDKGAKRNDNDPVAARAAYLKRLDEQGKGKGRQAAAK